MVVESGSEVASELWSTEVPAATSVLAYPEARAALAAALRAGRLTEAGYSGAVADFEALHEQLHLVSIDRGLSQRAGADAERYGLRGYDAVHLASAKALGPDAALVTWDRRLADAAVESGYTVAPPRG